MQQHRDDRHLEDAIAKVTGMLATKRKVWANASPTFENFDIQDDLLINPIQFGLAMINLKNNRLKHRWVDHLEDGRFAEDTDAEDSLVDIASYAILTLGLFYRERERAVKELAQHEIDPEIVETAIALRPRLVGDQEDEEPPQQGDPEARDIVEYPKPALCDLQGNPLHQFCPDPNCKYLRPASVANTTASVYS